MKLTTILALTIAINLWAQDSSVRTGSGPVKGAASITASIRSAANVYPRPLVMIISGQVRDADGRAAREATVGLVPRDRQTGLLGSVQQTSQTDAKGNFAIRGVPPGSYVVVANLNQGSKEYWGERRIEVVDTNISNIQLQLRGPSNLSGKVSAAGSFNFQGVSVQLSPEDGNSSDSSADLASDGILSFPELRRTTYRIQLAGLPDGWYLRSATMGNENALNHGVDLSEEISGRSLQITVTPGAGTLTGLVIDPAYRDAVPHAVVKLFPDPATPHRADTFRSAATDGTGHFVIKNVVPGRYRVLAIMGRGSDENSYSDFMTASGAGTRVTLHEKQSRNLELELFEAHR